MAGFGSPVALLAGFIFGKWLGVIIVIFGLSIGATLLYIFGNYFLKELIKDKFLDKFKIWNELNKNMVVINEVIVPGAYLIVPIPKKVTNKKFIFLIIFDYRSYYFTGNSFFFSNNS